MFANALTEFGRTYGLENLALDEHHACSLMLDDMVVNLELTPETNELAVYSSLGSLRPPVDSEVLGQLLEANYLQQFTDGAALGWDPKSGNLALSKQVSAQNLDAVGVTTLLESFANVAAAWTQKIENLRTGGRQSAPSPDGLAVRV